MFEKEIAKGMEWLDKNRPGWHEKIDLKKFDITCKCRCVLGQVFGTSEDESMNASSQWGFNIAQNTFRPLDVCGLGFDLEQDMEMSAPYRTLDKEWIAAIRQRQQQPIVTPAQPAPAERPAAHQALTTLCLR